MTLILDMAPEMEAQVREKAAREGLEPERYVLGAVEELLGQQGQASEPHLNRAESELLQQINEGLPADTWREYRMLIAKRDAETLTEEEYQALIRLTDTVEIAHARRIGHLVELANLRETTLDELMDALGIGKPNYV